MEIKDSDTKKVVFISHATPDDNEFVLWLSTRLKLEGYEVWSDVTKLFGGEVFWADIEDAILNHSCKFIIVITKTSLSKVGVQREINFALSVVESNKTKNFILPVIIDDSSFSNQPYGFSERNIISFKDSWADGYSKVIKRFEEDLVPTKSDFSIKIGEFISTQLNLRKTLSFKEDISVSNWLRITNIPDNLNFYRLPIKSDLFIKRVSKLIYPWFEHKSLLATFANLSDIKQILYNWEAPLREPKLSIKTLFDRELVSHCKLPQEEAFKNLNFLITDAWSITMQEMGLHIYKLANDKSAFFFPNDDCYMGMHKFPDIYGEEKRRSVVGYSNKYSVFWHYAVQVKAQFGHQPKICLIPHVVFTVDGKNPISDKNKMHQLRRSFCKSWWNARWRDMLLAYLSIISNDADEIVLTVASDNMIIISARPITLQTPVSVEIDDEYQQNELTAHEYEE